MIDTSVVSITPYIAEVMLENNAEEQRNVSRMRVKRYASDMANGLWTMNGETIIIDERGKLIDGQHRLLAVIESGVTAEFLVVRGVKASSYKTLDQGMSRRLTDLVSGVRGAAATAAKAAAVYEATGDIGIAVHNGRAVTEKCSNRMAAQWIEEHKSETLWLGDHYARLRRTVGKMSSVVAGAGLWALKLKGYDVDSFVRELSKAYTTEASEWANIFARSMLKADGSSAESRQATLKLLLWLGEKYEAGERPKKDRSAKIDLSDYNINPTKLTSNDPW